MTSLACTGSLNVGVFGEEKFVKTISIIYLKKISKKTSEIYKQVIRDVLHFWSSFLWKYMSKAPRNDLMLKLTISIIAWLDDLSSFRKYHKTGGNKVLSCRMSYSRQLENRILSPTHIKDVDGVLIWHEMKQNGHDGHVIKGIIIFPSRFFSVMYNICHW